MKYFSVDLKKNQAVFAFKLFVTVILIWFVFQKTDWSLLTGTLTQTRMPLLMAAFLVMLFGVPLSAYKWQKILQIHHQSYNIKKLTGWYYIAMFFNNFLPTSIGGDSYRILQTINTGCLPGVSVLAILSERVSGLLVLLGLGLAGAWSGWLNTGHDLSGSIVTTGNVLIGAALIFLIAIAVFIRKKQTPKPLPAGFISAIMHVKEYINQPAASIYALIALSIIFHVLSILWRYLLFIAIGGSINLWDFTLVIALLALVTMIPVSFNGIGTVDVAFIWLVSQFDVPFETGLSYMILFRVILLPISLVGAILYLKAGRVNTPETKRS